MPVVWECAVRPADCGGEPAAALFGLHRLPRRMQALEGAFLEPRSFAFGRRSAEKTRTDCRKRKRTVEYALDRIDI